MATESIDVNNPYNNVTSTVLEGGTISLSNRSKVNSTQLQGRDLANVSGVKESVDVGTANTTLAFSWNNPRPLVKGYSRRVNTATVDTVSKDLGTSGSAAVEMINSVHINEYRRTRLVATAIRDGFYNPYSGEFDIGYPDNIQDYFEIDNAAITSRNNTANIFFYNGISTNTRAYDKKTG